MDGYVAKPLQPADLFDTVERHVANRHHDRPASADSSALSTSRTQPTGQPASQLLPPSPDASRDFNRVQALEQTGGDAEILQEMVAAFFAEYPSLMAEVRDAIAQRDAPRLRLAGHTLKGAAKALAASAVSDAAEQLEAMGRSGDLAGAPLIGAELAEALRRLCTALRAEWSVS